MAAPQAPVPLFSQAAAGQNIVITVVLQGLSTAAAGFTAGTTYNSGNPTATFTLSIPAAPITGENIAGTGGSAAVTNSAAKQICDLVEQLWREGSLVAT